MSDYGMFTEEILYTANGIRRTRSLFKEFAVSGDMPVFTLRRAEGYVRIKDLYIKFCVSDPSEADFAETVFGDVSFWKNIAKCDWIQEDLREWRETAEVKRKSKAFKAIIKEVESKGRASFSASKFLIEEPWKDKRDPKTKTQNKKTTSKASVQVRSDIQRLQEEGLIN